MLHLLYARFWVKVLQDLGLVDFPEPFLRLRSVGLVLAEDGKKMSKSIGNVVNPDDMVAKYGSDAVRMYEMFMGPWEQSIAWDSGAISGQVRFLGRIMETAKNSNKVVINGNTSPVLAAKLKELVERVERGVLEQKFNTSIAGLMEWVNAWREDGVVVSREHVGMFASLLSLFAPKLAEEIGVSKAWPDVSGIEGVESVMVTIAVQVPTLPQGSVTVSVTRFGPRLAQVKVVGDTLKVKVMDIDKERNRISLSVNALIEGYEPPPRRPMRPHGGFNQGGPRRGRPIPRRKRLIRKESDLGKAPKSLLCRIVSLFLSLK